MIRNGLVVVGAAGALGESCCAAAGSRAEVILRFDEKEDANKGVLGCDLQDDAQIQKALSAIPFSQAEKWHLLVTSGIYTGNKTSLDWVDLRKSLNINLIGVTLFVTGFVQSLLSYGHRARIVVVSSAAARVGSRDIGYGTAKAGIEGLVRSLSKAYAASGVTTLGLAPGIFASKMSDGQAAERVTAAVDATHLKRMARLEEISACAMFLVFEAPDALTGTFMSPNGGQV